MYSSHCRRRSSSLNATLDPRPRADCALIRRFASISGHHSLGLTDPEHDLAGTFEASHGVDDLLLRGFDVAHADRAQVLHLFAQHGGGPLREIAHDLLLEL